MLIGELSAATEFLWLSSDSVRTAHLLGSFSLALGPLNRRIIIWVFLLHVDLLGCHLPCLNLIPLLLINFKNVRHQIVFSLLFEGLLIQSTADEVAVRTCARFHLLGVIFVRGEFRQLFTLLVLNKVEHCIFTDEFAIQPCLLAASLEAFPMHVGVEYAYVMLLDDEGEVLLHLGHIVEAARQSQLE